VFGFDLQAAAVESTRAKLRAGGVEERSALFHASHERMAEMLPPAASGRLAAVVFNLGYLPGGDKAVITRWDSTLAALDQALTLLAPGGALVVVTYPGHEGGDDEAAQVGAYLAALPAPPWTVQRISAVNRPAARPPECWVATSVPSARP
jgi:threonine dehydrogenase-like Zn-dependent dehydrogenase